MQARPSGQVEGAPAEPRLGVGLALDLAVAAGRTCRQQRRAAAAAVAAAAALPGSGVEPVGLPRAQCRARGGQQRLCFCTEILAALSAAWLHSVPSLPSCLSAQPMLLQAGCGCPWPHGGACCPSHSKRECCGAYGDPWLRPLLPQPTRRTERDGRVSGPGLGAENATFHHRPRQGGPAPPRLATHLGGMLEAAKARQEV